MRLLVVLRAANFDRITEGFLRCALERGHTVRVALEQKKAGSTADAENLFDVLDREFPNFSFGLLPAREERWLFPATKLRFGIDYLRYLEPEFAESKSLRDRAKGRAPWYVRAIAATQVLRIGFVRRGLDKLLRSVERRMPVSEQSLAMLREADPDVLVVSPLVELGSGQGDHIRAADTLGIPTALVVASWDNLTTKGALRDAPDRTIVWNHDQVREAVEMHGLPAESVVATGAHSHDHWFSWQPSTGTEEFAAKVGLDAGSPFLLYVCSSGFIAGADEVAFVREWAGRLAASSDPDLREFGVLVRPHPQNFGSWANADIEEPGRIVVWPRGGVAPKDVRSKDDYFDSLYHARAVVGINTSALVDSAIVRRPVFTIVSEHFRDTQTGTIHFSYLARDEGAGLLSVAGSWDEHFDQLGEAIRDGDARRAQIDEFLRAFIRPNGLDRDAAPQALAEIETVAAADKEPVPAGGPLRWMVGATAGGLGRWHELLQGLRPAVVRKKLRRRQKQSRRRKLEKDRQRARGGRPAKALKADSAKQKQGKQGKPGKPAKKQKQAKQVKPGKPGKKRKPPKQAKPGKKQKQQKPHNAAKAAKPPKAPTGSGSS